MAEIAGLNKNHPLYVEDLRTIGLTDLMRGLFGKSILISGATGLLGTFLIDTLMFLNTERQAGINVYAVGRDRNKAFTRLGEYYTNPLFHFIEQDVREPFCLTDAIDYIIPLASNTHPLAYSQFPVETVEINYLGAVNALELAERTGATVLYPSSVEVYGNARGKDIFTEGYTGQLNLNNARACYPESKRVCEALCQSFLAERGTNVKIVRLSRVFGPTMQLSDTKASSQFILKALNKENIVLKSEGTQLFSYIYAADAVYAMLYVMLRGETGEVYNIANDNCNILLRDFANLCARQVGKQVVFELPSEVERKGYSVASQAILSTDKIRALGWKPWFDIETAVERTIKILS